MQVPFYRHSLKPEDASKIASVLGSPFLTSGPVCKDVEAQLVDYFGVKHAKLVNSWTNGAVATLLALDIGPGDEVIVPAMTFIATANVVELVGAKPVFVDCDSGTLLMTSDLVKKAITSNTKAIIPVHMYGQMCDVKAIKEILPKDRKIYIIEDCAHSFESKLNNERPGKYSDVAIFSFYATKNVTCGEGGAIITNDEKIHERLIQSVLHGMSAGAADRFKGGQYKHWGMEHLGTKANLPDILAALLPEQIKSIDKNLEIREELYSMYEKNLNKDFYNLTKTQSSTLHSRHLCPVFVAPKLRDKLIYELGQFGISTTVNYNPIHHMNFYRKKYRIEDSNLPVSSKWGSGTLSLPLFPSLKKEEQLYVIKVANEVIKNLTGKM
jgi:dTDP-4-amino-4,6-dideoxygalactose transaminase